MRNFFLTFILFSFSFCISQNTYNEGKNGLQFPKEGKSLVYVIKSGAGFLLNFRVFKDDKFIGALASGNYFIIECDPGKHLFWATSENRDFVEANLEANKVYILNLEGQMGAFIASVSLKPLKPTEKRDRRFLYRALKNTKAIIYNPNDVVEDKSENIKEGLEKYKELKDRNSSKIRVLNPEDNFINAEKPE
jgi:hypothetical protein